MSKQSYWEMLRDPRWQKMRLEVMDREGFKCQECGDDGTTLNVHHTYYQRGFAPWEYPAESLRCLCEVCHKIAEDDRLAISRELFAMTRAQQLAVLGYARGMTADWCGCDHVFDCVETFDGMIDYWIAEESRMNCIHDGVRQNFTKGESVDSTELLKAIWAAQKVQAEMEEEFEDSRRLDWSFAGNC